MGLRSILATTLIAAASVVGSFVYYRWKQLKIPTDWERIGSVKKLYLYPLKSGHRLELDRAQVTEVGLKQTEDDEKVYQLRDRALVVYGAKDHEFRTARTYPKMVLIDVTVHDETHLAIDAPTMRTLYVKIPTRPENQEVNIKCWYNEKINGLDCGDEAASWFSRYIIERDAGLRLAFNDGGQKRDITKTHQKLLNYYTNLGNEATGLFSDLSSVSIINQQSINDMNKKGGNSISVENFRPNVVVDDYHLQPYAEDNWEWIKIGDEVITRNVKECTRCTLTTINAENGVRDKDREPLKTLEKYRKSDGPEKTPVMGLNLSVKRTGFIRVGDPVYVSKKGQK